MQEQQTLSILFVDDEPAILALIPRILADMRETWRMEFAESAEKAIARIGAVQFDVVVSDVHMPGMNGVDFLKEVRERCPLSARIVYSSASDQSAILDCVGVAHQFLQKPCSRNALKGTILRATLMRSLLPNPAMRETISKMEGIPSMPSLYTQLFRQLRSVETPIAEIAATISQDLGMTAQILKIVNSAYFGLPRPTSNIAEAISCLGIEAVKYLALGVGIFSQFESRKIGGISLETLWRHSVRTANAARLIAKTVSAGCQLTEDALAAGLLHDVGKLVLATSYPDRYEMIARNAEAKQVEWLMEEREVFGFDHADVGGYLLGLWGLPAAVVEAVAFHHFPTKSERTYVTALTAVHVANVLVQTQRRSYGGIVPPEIDLIYLARTGRVDQLDSWRDAVSESPAI